eukprot:TRINITY_DN3256_c0_g2_i1.p1 TRINITY_DN3256_c0_g2~~TRINITY_DN3256_c0_g2_i1.p1  ORF type:complete len:862 (-),score=133.87 TRINITY_DN3256_c0_g2_i1:360-2945(-)
MMAPTEPSRETRRAADNMVEELVKQPRLLSALIPEYLFSHPKDSPADRERWSKLAAASQKIVDAADGGQSFQALIPLVEESLKYGAPPPEVRKKMEPFLGPREGNLLDTKTFEKNDADGKQAIDQTASFGQTNTPPHAGYEEHLFGPDGMPLQGDAVVETDEEGHIHAKIGSHHKVEMSDQGWFHAESNRYEQEELAKIHLTAICKAVVERQQAGLCRDGRWVNSPNEFEDLGLTGTVNSNAVIPFPPNDQQYFITGRYDPELSTLRPAAVPKFGHDGAASSSWVRLVDFAQHADAVHLYDEFSSKTHCGRILQGSLDNGYFVEALQAIAMRPKVVKQLFYGWNSRRSVYVARLFKHGTWMRVELDDYVPVGRPGRDDKGANLPVCTRSEYFPNVIWPCLIEKAYAKIHTMRASFSAITTEQDWGGWEALNGGGKVEDALADLTGGVAGRFYTDSVSPDRLFIYIYELQRDTIFVCRPDQEKCEAHGVRLNPYYPNVVNRAVTWEGGLYIQCFCGAPGVFDGGLQDITVPFTLTQCEDYPETRADGFFWVNALDFHEYFKEIFECRLVNSGDVALPNMPAPRFQTVLSPMAGMGDMGMPAGMLPGMTNMGGGMQPGQQALMGMPHQELGPDSRPYEDVSFEAMQRGMQHAGPDGKPLAWYEWIYATSGDVHRGNAPEFQIKVSQGAAPCEVVCTVEQMDPRMQVTEPGPMKQPVAVLLKVYEKVTGENYYDSQLVCRSNWIPARDSMVAFSANRGSEFLVTAELPDVTSSVHRMIFRCYANRPAVMVSASAMSRKHMLVDRQEPAGASRLSLVGLLESEGDTRDEPVMLDWEQDCMRKPEFDMEFGFSSIAKEVKEDCVVM